MPKSGSHAPSGLETEFSGMNLVSSARKETGSTIASSPASDDAKEPFPGSPSIARKFQGSVPSPIGKGHSKNTSATSPLLTLTPNSSVDGNSDWQNIGKQASPFHEDAPVIPFLNVERRSGGSFPELNSESLLGYGSLRDRTHSLPAFGIPSENRPRDRPPLSHPSQETGSFQGDRSVGERSTGSLGLSSIHSNREIMLDSNDSLVLGSIGRTGELRQGAAEFEPSRRRAASQDNSMGNYFHPGSFDPSLSNKFGSLPSLSSHIRQQRVPQSVIDAEKPRHVRSVSQPVSQASQHQYGAFGHPSSFGNGLGYIGPSDGFRMSQSSRGAGYPGLSSSYEGPSSHNLQSFAPGMGNHQALQRRDALDFQGVPPGYIGSVSPGHSPLHAHFDTHSRQPSDGSGLLYQSSPVSLHQDDDHSHPLAGEHIEVPAEHMDNDQTSSRQHPAPYLRSLSAGHYTETASVSPAVQPGSKSVYSVKFKRTQRNFLLGPRIQRDLKIGTYVKVEADRGEDLGIVVGKLSAEKYSYSRASFTAGMGPSGPAGVNDLKRIIRLATHDEVSLLSVKRDEEEELLNICRAKVRQRALPMNVVDAEYQFDRHKLTFFFEAEGRVDFRELVRDLFSMYKTRIWMQQIDKNTSTAAQAMMSPPSKDLQVDNGTPIIAPASEFADSVNMAGF